ncbi:hypothetical protein GCK32_022490, partial [Trichostrongylus colubriformis]
PLIPPVLGLLSLLLLIDCELVCVVLPQRVSVLNSTTIRCYYTHLLSVDLPYIPCIYA